MPISKFLVALCFLLSAACTHQTSVEDAVVAKVNNSQLTVKEFALRLANSLRNMSSIAAKDENIISETKSHIIQKFVHATLIADWAKKEGLFVRKEDLDKKIENIRRQYPDESTFRQALVNSNLDYEKWVQNLKHSLLEELVSLRLRSVLPELTDKQLKQYYNDNKSQFKVGAQRRVYQIVLKDEESAKRIYKRLRKGAKFSSMAKKFSTTPEAELGGDLGWVTRGESPLFDTVFRARLNRSQKPLKSYLGHHILMATKHRKSRTKSFKEVRADIERVLLAEMEQGAYSQWLERELVKVKVYKNDNLISSINIATKLNN